MATDLAVAPPLVDVSDGALREAHPDGGSDGFGDRCHRYRPALVSLCRRRAGDPDTAEDLAQEALFRALRYADSYDGTGPLWPWLKTIATRVVIDHDQRLMNQEVPVDPDSSTVEEVGLDPFDDLAHEGPILAEALRQLSSRHRAALQLRYVDGWDPHDAADFLGLTRNAFEQLLFRARNKLREQYEALTSEARHALAASPFGAFLTRLRSRFNAFQTRVLEAPLPYLAAAPDAIAHAVAAVALVSVGALGGAAVAYDGPAATSRTAPRSDSSAAAQTDGQFGQRLDVARSHGAAAEGTTAPTRQVIVHEPVAVPLAGQGDVTAGNEPGDGRTTFRADVNVEVENAPVKVDYFLSVEKDCEGPVDPAACQGAQTVVDEISDDGDA